MDKINEEDWWVAYNDAHASAKKKPEAREWVLIEDPYNKRRYFQKLSVQQNVHDSFPESNGIDNPNLPQNREESLRIQKAYEEELPEYSKTNLGIPNETIDFWKENEINCGHKLHLNVAIKNVKKVSEYLVANNICHKYLFGGEIDDGKIFTIYTGSKDMTDKIAKKLSADLGDLLCKPIDNSEIEYAPNVIGRFKGSSKDFHQYGCGIRGISMLMEDARIVILAKDESHIPLAFQKAYQKLAEEHGIYFYGSGN